MSKDLLDFINSLKILSFVLTDGFTYLGKLSSESEDEYELVALMKLTSNQMENVKDVLYILTPVNPFSIESESFLKKDKILIKSIPSITLKHFYVNTLLKLKVKQILPMYNNETQLNPMTPIDLENSKNLKNPLKNRWGS